MRPARSLKQRLTLVATFALLAAASSCISRPIPIPPPMAQVQALTDCDGSAECPAGGVIVDVEGLANPGALVLVENLTRPLANGVLYSASAFANRSPDSDASSSDGGVPNVAGRFFIRLGPMRSAPGSTVVASQRGDMLSVRQFVEVEGGRFEASNGATFTIR
jgi:hypothetical protein